MAFTLGDLNAIDDAIKTGVRRVKYEDKEVQYHSLAEMREIRAIIKSEIDFNSGSDVGAGGLTVHNPTFRKGL